MIEIFNDSFKNKNHKKMIVAITIIVSGFIFYILSGILFFKLSYLFKKEIFIILFSLISFVFLSIIYISFKWYSYQKSILKISNSFHSHEILEGVICKKDIYNITLKGLLYEQYIIKEKSDRIIYVLYGIDINHIVDKKVKVSVKNNILYAYEVIYE